MDRAGQRRTLWGDVSVAVLLAALLSAVWAWRDWANQSALHLPDTDDVMRLQQIRDWLSGQSFGDLAQHRLGGGLPMHWSRLADLVPGAIIAALTPLAGAHVAELTAVIVWPAALFAGALLLVGRIARVLSGAATARTAIVVAAVAYPATTVFVPGRIDHHGLQVVLLLGVVRALVAPAGMASGLAAGLCAAAGFVVGMETAPLFAAAGVAMVLSWVLRREGEAARLMGLGIGLGAGLLAASIVFQTAQWTYPACDGFTATLFRGAIVAAFAPMGIALLARDGMGHGQRAGIALAVGGAVAGGIVWIAPTCLTPYGGVDPLLARLWLGQVGEAQHLFAAPPATAIGYAGVMVAGLVATAWACRETRDPRWTALLLIQLAAAALTCWQLRGAYFGAMLAAPGLAAAIVAARARGAGWLAAAWLASAGMLYPIAAAALVRTPAESGSGDTVGSCTDRAAIGALATLPPGRMIAPLDLGAYAIGATRLDLVAAPYHRNAAGNLAAYRFFLGDAQEAAAVARAWRFDYVAVCAGGLGGLPPDAERHGALDARLRHDDAPAWLLPVRRTQGLSVYRVEPGLLETTRAR